MFAASIEGQRPEHCARLNFTSADLGFSAYPEFAISVLSSRKNLRQPPPRVKLRGFAHAMRRVSSLYSPCQRTRILVLGDPGSKVFVSLKSDLFLFQTHVTLNMTFNACWVRYDKYIRLD